MSDQSSIEKIKKAASKKNPKGASVIKIIEGKHADADVICAGLEALSSIADEDSVNEITHFLDHPDSKVRVAACRAGIKIGTEYMRTRVQYQLSTEADAEAKQLIRNAYNEKFK